ncbi:MAG: tyrosine-type recombinase/integrase [Planctomycetota bacterium JB042]
MDGIEKAVAEAVRAALGRRRATLPTEETLERYLAWQRTRKTHKSWSTDRGYVLRFFAAAGVADLAEVTTASVTAYLAAMAESGRSPKTLNRVREVLHTLFAWLVEQELLDSNPVKRVRRAPEPAPSIRFLTLLEVDELLATLAAADPLLLPVGACLVFAGLRRGELCWLRWEDVDLDRRVLLVRSKPGRWTPKTKRNRIVPISSRLAPVLEALPRSTEWVFPSPKGAQWNGDNLGHRWRKVLNATGRAWTMLDLRHTFGTQLVMKGVSLAKVAALMGNSPEICRRHYAHVSTEDLHADVEF